MKQQSHVRRTRLASVRRWALLLTTLSVIGGCANVASDFCSLSEMHWFSEEEWAALEHKTRVREAAHNRTVHDFCR